MEVSVIIPNYNHATFLKQRIESVLHQTYQDFEIMILDDCSTDNSKEIIEQYRDHSKISHIIYNETNSGSSFKQWQEGITLAKGNLIWIAESDDVSAPGFLEKTTALLQQDNKIGIVYCRTMQIDENGNECGVHYWPDALDDKRWTKPYFNNGINELQNYFLYRNVIVNASSAVFKKEFALAAIQYVVQKNIRFCGDWLFYTRMLMHSNIAYLPGPLNFQRYHPLTTRFSKTNEEELQRVSECIECIKESSNFLKIKINWSDKRYNWIYTCLSERCNLSLKDARTFIQKNMDENYLNKIVFNNNFKKPAGALKSKIKTYLQHVYKALKAG